MRRHSEAPNEGSWHGVVGRTSRRKQQHHASSRWDQIVATERNPTKHAPLKRSNPTRRETLRLRLALANRKLQSCPLRGIRWVCPATAPDSLVDCQTGFTRILLEKELRPWIHVGRSSNCLSLVESARTLRGGPTIAEPQSLTPQNPFRTIRPVRVVSSMVEQRTLNPLVAGSSPARPRGGVLPSRVVSSVAEHLTFNQGVAGSNPARPTSIETKPGCGL